MADPVLFSNGFFAWSTSTGAAAADQVKGIKSIELPFNKAELANSVMGDGAATFYPGIMSIRSPSSSARSSPPEVRRSAISGLTRKPGPAGMRGPSFGSRRAR